MMVKVVIFKMNQLFLIYYIERNLEIKKRMVLFLFMFSFSYKKKRFEQRH
jgi:hypothetical protein